MNVKFQYGDGLLMVRKLSMLGKEYYFKSYENMNYVYYGDTLYAFAKSNEFNKGLFLFGLVKKDFDKWIENNPNPVFSENYRSYCYSKNNPKGKQYSYDINHAFWRIAFNNNYISKSTYEHGLRIKTQNESLKKLYSMALSVQGQSRKLDGYVDVKGTGKSIIIAKNPIHKDIYNDIRNKTFKTMDDLAFLLKDDFVSYNVDCITFVNKKNEKIVSEYLTSKSLTFKKIN